MEPRRKKSREPKATDVIHEHYRALTSRSSSGYRLTDEFNNLENISGLEDNELSCSCAELLENLGKNRYINVLARMLMCYCP